MKYYRINQIIIDLDRKAKGLSSDLPSANGQFVPDSNIYFDKIGNGEIIDNAPIFDYFHLESFGPKSEWEWRLQDVHGGMGEYPRGAYWYISDDFKTLLENFKIAPQYYFYETRLLYKGEKYKYWIFQFPIEPFNNINFNESEFGFVDENSSYSFISTDEYLAFYRKEYRENKRKLITKKICFAGNYDLILNVNTNEKLVSENLKEAIERMQLEGFLFSEIHYEVIVNSKTQL